MKKQEVDISKAGADLLYRITESIKINKAKEKKETA